MKFPKKHVFFSENTNSSRLQTHISDKSMMNRYKLVTWPIQVCGVSWRNRTRRTCKSWNCLHVTAKHSVWFWNRIILSRIFRLVPNRMQMNSTWLIVSNENRFVSSCLLIYENGTFWIWKNNLFVSKSNQINKNRKSLINWQFTYRTIFRSTARRNINFKVNINDWIIKISLTEPSFSRRLVCVFFRFFAFFAIFFVRRTVCMPWLIKYSNVFEMQ